MKTKKILLFISSFLLLLAISSCSSKNVQIEETESVSGETKFIDVIFYGPGGNIIKTDTAEAGSVIPPDNSFVPENNIFTGWDKDVINADENLEFYPLLKDLSEKDNAIFFNSVYQNDSNEICLDVKLAGKVNLSGIELEMDFDKDLLEFSEIIFCDGDGMCNYDKETGKIYFALATAENINGSVDLFRVKFNVKNYGVNTGCVNMHVNDISSIDENGNIGEEKYYLENGNIFLREEI